jgi:dTDP-4-amino-4,6-dideoxygalactose transaminase
MDILCEIARRHQLHVVEDAAQAIGARLQGRPACSWGVAGCLSFYPTKNLGGCGDGGMIVTQDADLARRLRLLAAHGMHPRYYHSLVGVNSRLDTLQAAALLVKLNHLADWNLQRRQNALTYCRLFQLAALDRHILLPSAAPGSEHVWNQFTIRIPGGRRDRLREYLGQRGIGSEIYYPLPLHRQACFHSLGYEPGSLPQSERAADEVLSLPIFPGLRLDEQQAVVNHIAEFFAMPQSAAA